MDANLILNEKSKKKQKFKKGFLAKGKIILFNFIKMFYRVYV